VNEIGLSELGPQRAEPSVRPNPKQEARTNAMPQIAQLAATYASQIFWLLVCFGVVFFVIGRGMLPGVVSTIDQRNKRIADDLGAAEAARTAADAEEQAWRIAEGKQRAQAHNLIAAAKARLPTNRKLPWPLPVPRSRKTPPLPSCASGSPALLRSAKSKAWLSKLRKTSPAVWPVFRFRPKTSAAWCREFWPMANVSETTASVEQPVAGHEAAEPPSTASGPARLSLLPCSSSC
jgi:hypothetical protein